MHTQTHIHSGERKSLQQRWALFSWAKPRQATAKPIILKNSLWRLPLPARNLSYSSKSPLSHPLHNTFTEHNNFRISIENPFNWNIYALCSSISLFFGWTQRLLVLEDFVNKTNGYSLLPLHDIISRLFVCHCINITVVVGIRVCVLMLLR